MLEDQGVDTVGTLQLQRELIELLQLTGQLDAADQVNRDHMVQHSVQERGLQLLRLSLAGYLGELVFWISSLIWSAGGFQGQAVVHEFVSVVEIGHVTLTHLILSPYHGRRN